jgi:hypothetical protein
MAHIDDLCQPTQNNSARKMTGTIKPPTTLYRKNTSCIFVKSLIHSELVKHIAVDGNFTISIINNEKIKYIENIIPNTNGMV